MSLSIVRRKRFREIPYTRLVRPIVLPNTASRLAKKAVAIPATLMPITPVHIIVPRAMPHFGEQRAGGCG
jgi:hypothetical protein